MKKPGAPKKGAKMHAPHKSGGGAKRKGVRASGAPVPAPAKHHHPAPHHPHHPPGHRMTNPLVPAPHHHRHVKPKQPVKRKLALGEGVACCSAEALAASLRLLGVPVGDEDVLALYWRTAADADAGASISATLEAADRKKPGAWPGFSYAPAGEHGGGPRLVTRCPGCVLGAYQAQSHASSLILGVTLPGGPHALLADGDTWWSWGEPYPRSAFSGAVIEEAWAVQWAA